MAQDTLLGFPAHTLPYRCGGFTTLSTDSKGHDKRHALLLNIETIFQIYAVLPDTQCRDPSGTFAILRIKPPMIAMGMEIARETGFK